MYRENLTIFDNVTGYVLVWYVERESLYTFYASNEQLDILISGRDMRGLRVLTAEEYLSLPKERFNVITEEYTQAAMPLTFHGRATQYTNASYWYDAQGHYPCQSPTCSYCDCVRCLINELVCDWDDRFVDGLDSQYYYTLARGRAMYVTTGRQIGSDIATYEDYRQLCHDRDYACNVNLQTGERYLEVSGNDLLWRSCDGCDKRVLEWVCYNHGGYCSAECHADNQVYYCRDCGDETVYSEGDLCHTCKERRCYSCGQRINSSTSYNYDHQCRSCYDNEYAEEEYERGEINGHEYSLGDIVDVKDYADLPHCWIDLEGNARYVGYCKHETTARKLGFTGVDQAERSGWIHVSSYWSRFRRFHYVPDRPTRAQLFTMWAYADATGTEYHSTLKEFVGKLKEDAIKPMTYEVTQSCLPRKMRDIWYPLSGD